jgi:hypothetical protein
VFRSSNRLVDTRIQWAVFPFAGFVVENMAGTQHSPVISTSSVGGKIFPTVVLAAVLLSATHIRADKRSGRQVDYVAGTFTEIHVGCTGTLDARDPSGLLIVCGGERLTIPQSTIIFSRIIESQQDARELGLSEILITRRKGRQLVYIRTGSMDNSKWLLLELPANYARDLVVYIIRQKEDRDGKNGAKAQ